MGEVYRATDTVLGRTVAVKLLSEGHARDPDVRARFEREGLAAARLSGEPNVVMVFDVGEHEGRPFIVMQYRDGGSVADRLRTGRPDRTEALAWLEQAARALDAAHAHGIVHRDVKPANLLLDQEDTVCVSDFGIASTSGSDTLTLPGTVLGTAGYLSPEQARGEPSTPESDRYALGVVAFELLTGQRPFAADTAVTEALRHVNDPVPRASSIAPDLPPELDDVFIRALAKRPSDRPSSCAELVRDLRGAFVEAVAPTLVAPPPRPARSRRHRGSVPSRAYALAALVVLLSGLGVAALVGATGDDEPRRRANGNSSPISTPDRSKGASLNDAGYERMLAGDYDGALPLLNRAVDALVGSGSLAEAYASYNLAYSRLAVGRCNGVLTLLNISQQIQGPRGEIDELRGRAQDACLEESVSDEGDEGDGKSNGKGRGKAKGHDD